MTSKCLALAVHDDPIHQHTCGRIIESACFQAHFALIDFGRVAPPEGPSVIVSLHNASRIHPSATAPARLVQTSLAAAPVVVLSDTLPLSDDSAPYIPGLVGEGDAAKLIIIPPQTLEHCPPPEMFTRDPKISNFKL